MNCECPRHNEHVKNFIRKYPGADGKFGIVDVEPGEWLVNLEHPEKNTAHCCQLCCVLEDTKRVTSSGWNGQPASYNPFEWKVRYNLFAVLIDTKYNMANFANNRYILERI